MFRYRDSDGYGHHSPFHKGDIKYVILDILKDKASYGYEIIQDLKERSHGFYKPSPGVIYPTLQMLEESGYAVSREIDQRKIYEITTKGLEFLDKRSNFADRIRDHMDHHWNFKNAGKLRQLLKEFSSLRMLLGPNIRDLDEDRLEKIQKKLARTRIDIEDIINS